MAVVCYCSGGMFCRCHYFFENQFLYLHGRTVVCLLSGIAQKFDVELEIRSVEHGICPIAEFTSA